MLQEFKDRISIRNIRANLLLIISSFAFMGLNLQRDPQKIIALPVAMLVIVLFFSIMPDVPGRYRKTRTGVRIYAAFSAACFA